MTPTPRLTREQVKYIATFLPQFVNDNMPKRLLAHDAALRARIEELEQKSESFWLIERGSPAEWWAGNHGPQSEWWARDVYKVHPLLRFRTREGAQFEADRIMTYCGVTGPLRVTDHMSIKECTNCAALTAELAQVKGERDNYKVAWQKEAALTDSELQHQLTAVSQREARLRAALQKLIYRMRYEGYCNERLIASDIDRLLQEP